MKENARSSPILGKSLKLLDTLGEQRSLTFTELAKRTGFPKSTLHRLLESLSFEGLISFNSVKRTYTLGLRPLSWARDAWDTLEIRKLALEEMKKLNDTTGETVHLAVLDRDQIVYIEKFESKQQVRMYSSVGKRAPAYCTGIGKAIIAFLESDMQQALTSRLSFKRYTDRTIVNVEALQQELLRIRAQGYARDDGEHEAEIRCIAAPIVNYMGHSVAGISVSAPAYRLTPEGIEAWIPLVKEAVARVSALTVA